MLIKSFKVLQETFIITALFSKLEHLRLTR